MSLKGLKGLKGLMGLMGSPFFIQEEDPFRMEWFKGLELKLACSQK